MRIYNETFSKARKTEKKYGKDACRQFGGVIHRGWERRSFIAFLLLFFLLLKTFVSCFGLVCLPETLGNTV